MNRQFHFLTDNTFQEYLRSSCRTLEPAAARHGIEFEKKIVVSNDIVNAIATFAKSDRSDVIVIGARGQSSPKSAFLGSVSHGILNSCRIPILVVR